MSSVINKWKCIVAATWWSLVSAVSNLRLETALADSHVASNSVLRVNRLDIYFRLQSYRYRLATARFGVWSSNKELTIALHSSVRAGACYVTRRRGQGSLNYGATLVFSVFSILPLKRGQCIDSSVYVAWEVTVFNLNFHCHVLLSNTVVSVPSHRPTDIVRQLHRLNIFATR
jgi:hypothetical protein